MAWLSQETTEGVHCSKNLKNAFNVKFNFGEENGEGVQSLLKKKTIELRMLNTVELIENCIKEQENVKHFDKINYTLKF